MAPLFLLKTETFDAKNWREISVDAILCFLIEIFFEKKGQIHSNFDKQKFFNLTPHSAQGCSFCTANCIRRRFLISIHFVVIKLWVRIPFQIEDSLLALFLYLCFHKCVSVAF